MTDEADANGQKEGACLPKIDYFPANFSKDDEKKKKDVPERDGRNEIPPPPSSFAFIFLSLLLLFWTSWKDIAFIDP